MAFSLTTRHSLFFPLLASYYTSISLLKTFIRYEYKKPILRKFVAISPFQFPLFLGGLRPNNVQATVGRQPGKHDIYQRKEGEEIGVPLLAVKVLLHDRTSIEYNWRRLPKGVCELRNRTNWIWYGFFVWCMFVGGQNNHAISDHAFSYLWKSM